jgi:CubicO group peptidase (beta-lactamase class C family)
MRTRWIPIVLAVALGSVALATPVAAAPALCAAPTAAALQDFFGADPPDAPGGTVVTVVSGDRTVFAQGYGSLDAQRSLIRIASISKLFTWTAVMQQVQAGRLDLNTDVNHYLKTFRIPATYPQPITLLDLMNHTAGFEDQTIGLGARTAADVQPLGDYLATHIPARIRPPGQISAYSNYGAALAGYVVAQVSGQPWDQYVQLHMLDPLGMTHSTATEPVPAALAGDLAGSYDTDESPAKRVPFQFDQLSPDGAISATAADMGRFMSAQLNSTLLSPAMTALMQSTSYTADPRLGGFAHGFMERTINGHRVLMHDGGWEAFGSLLVLVPDCHLGVFVSSNTSTGVTALANRMTAFYDRFLPAVASTPVATAPTGAPVAGFYQLTRHNESTISKLLNLLGPARLTVGADGTVHFKGKVWTSDGAGLYRAADGSDHLVARDGYVATDGPVYQRMSPAETLPVNLVVLVVVLVLGLSGLIALLVAAFRRRPLTLWRASRLAAFAAAALALIFLVLLLVVLLGDTGAYLYGVPLDFRLLLIVPIVVLLGFAGALAGTVAGWRSAHAGVLVRSHQIALLIALAAFTWFTWQWNLIGWHLG